MPYGTIKVDNITFTDNSVDKTVSLSGLIQNPTFTGNVTATGTISGDVIRGGTTISGVTVTGTTANFVSGVFTTQISGATITGTTVAATTGNYTSLTGVTTTGTTANFVTFNGASGVFTTRVSGTTVTGTTANFTSGNFISLSGTTTTVTSGVFSAGSATAPSVAVGTGTTYAPGIYSPGTDQVAISTSGTGRVFVDGSGNVGVGGAASAWQYTALSVGFGGSAVSSDAVDKVQLGANFYRGSGADRFTGTGFATLYQQNAGAHAWFRSSASGTAGNAMTLNESMRIDSSGNVNIDSNTLYVDAVNNRVGIGTTGPSDLLHSAGNIRVSWGAYRVASVFDNSFRQGMAFDTTNRQLQIFSTTSDTGGSIGFFTRSTAGSSDTDYGTEKVRIDVSGRLLVGTSTTLAIGASVNGQLQVADTTVAIGSISTFVNGASGAYLMLGKSRGGTVGTYTVVISGDQLGIINFAGADGVNLQAVGASIAAFVDGTPGAGDMPGRLVFSTTADGAASPTERMRITSTGKTFISSTDSGYGQFQIGSTTSDGEVGITFIPGVTAFGSPPTSTNGDSRIWGIGPNIYAVGATQFAIGNKATGYVAKLASNTATSWTFSSDERLKNIEGPVTAATQIIEAINPVYYSFKADPVATRKVGLIAQNVLSALPEVVDVPEEEQDAEGNQRYMGLAMTDLVPVLIAALKESNLRIKELTDRVAALEGA